MHAASQELNPAFPPRGFRFAPTHLAPPPPEARRADRFSALGEAPRCRPRSGQNVHPFTPRSQKTKGKTHRSKGKIRRSRAHSKIGEGQIQTVEGRIPSVEGQFQTVEGRIQNWRRPNSNLRRPNSNRRRAKSIGRRANPNRQSAVLTESTSVTPLCGAY